MDALDTIRAGDVSKTLQLVKDDVRNSPQDPKHRIFLFQLFAIVGEWERALSQLKVAGELSEEASTLVQCYQHLLNMEAFRTQVFSGKKQPLVFGEPEPWMAGIFEANRLLATGADSQAEELLLRSLEEAPAKGGKIHYRVGGDEETSEAEFDWIADADLRYGPFIECVLNGKYYWIPMHRIESIQMDPPADLRDLVWMPAEFRWAGGGEMVGMLPCRYPLTEKEEDSALRLSRKTTWQQRTAHLQSGLGLRLFATESEDYPMLQIAKVEFS
ncbi:MAG: type VI secretion system accessory protein TagJ [Planctomycetota bacterium]|nr:type VI secretion system accessory protein TagJ [Planctomycetota bacterium]